MINRFIQHSVSAYCVSTLRNLGVSKGYSWPQGIYTLVGGHSKLLFCKNHPGSLFFLLFSHILTYKLKQFINLHHFSRWLSISPDQLSFGVSHPYTWPSVSFQELSVTYMNLKVHMTKTQLSVSSSVILLPPLPSEVDPHFTQKSISETWSHAGLHVALTSHVE